MHVLIIEDDLQLSEHLSRLFSNAFDEVTIHQAYTLEEAEGLLSKHAYPLMSIDLDLPDGNGLEFAIKYRNHFQQLQTEFFIISGTYDLETAFTAYDEAHCFKILPKPLSQKDFNDAIHRYKTKQVNNGNRSIFQYETKYTRLSIPYSEIQYFELTLKSCSLYTQNSAYNLGRLSIKELLALLPEKEFLQIHRSIVINLSKLRLINKETGKWSVQLEGSNASLPVGKTYQEVLHVHKSIY